MPLLLPTRPAAASDAALPGWARVSGPLMDRLWVALGTCCAVAPAAEPKTASGAQAEGGVGADAPHACIERTRDAFWPAYAICLPFWSSLHLVTFSGWIPVRHRMAWSSLVAVAWNALISDQNQKAIQRQRANRARHQQLRYQPNRLLHPQPRNRSRRCHAITLRSINSIILRQE